ncbi:hypothetical protein GCM10011414_24690 [Croceivirga lutea]|nr:hypothetical protein GCM10011414_24690 [Croceivirga lutea]
MNNKNIPKVKMVIGKVRMTKIGLTIKFNNPNTIATIKATVKEVTVTPGRTLASIKTAPALNNILKRNFIKKKGIVRMPCKYSIFFNLF